MSSVTPSLPSAAFWMAWMLRINLLVLRRRLSNISSFHSFRQKRGSFLAPSLKVWAMSICPGIALTNGDVSRPAHNASRNLRRLPIISLYLSFHSNINIRRTTTRRMVYSCLIFSYLSTFKKSLSFLQLCVEGNFLSNAHVCSKVSLKFCWDLEGEKTAATSVSRRSPSVFKWRLDRLISHPRSWEMYRSTYQYLNGTSRPNRPWRVGRSNGTIQCNIHTSSTYMYLPFLSRFNEFSICTNLHKFAQIAKPFDKFQHCSWFGGNYIKIN